MNIIEVFIIIGVGIIGFCFLSVSVIFTIGTCKEMIEDFELDELFKRKNRKIN